MIAGPDAPKNFQRILIVRLSAMGDVIHTIPAVQALRAGFPKATIGWLIEERWAQLLCAPETSRRGPRSAGRPLADWVHTVNLAGWRRSLFSVATVEQIARTWNDVRSLRYDVALDLQGAIRSAVLAQWSGAPLVYGPREPRETPSTMLYTRSVIARGRHVIEQYLSIVEALAGKRLSVPRVQFPRDCKAEQKIGQLLDADGVVDFAIINPGAGWGAKRWPAARYGAVARDLAAFGLRSIVNYGPGEDHLASAAQQASGEAARPLQCSITELIALTRRAKLFVGGDTGPLHLAAALQVPVVGIFGPTDPVRNGPYGTRSIVLRNPLSATSHARRADADEGMLEISVEEVLSAAGRLLASGTEKAHG